MVVFQIITRIGLRAILTGVILGLWPGAVVFAQTTGNDLPPVPQNGPAVNSYSLPPGPDSAPEQDILQGPVDPEIPLAKPAAVTPRTTPARVPAINNIPSSNDQVTGPAADNASRQIQQPTRRDPPEPNVTADKSAAETDSPRLEPAAAADERQEPPESETIATQTELPPTKAAAEPVPTTAATEWLLLSFAALLSVLLFAIFLWRARRVSSQKPVAAKADAEKTSATVSAAKLAETREPVAAITIGFHPRTANATLINAVLSFELTLSNHSSEVLTDIRVNGAMVQAKDDGSHDPAGADLLPLDELHQLHRGEDAKILTEFRIPLASIDPIMFQAQALFVPMVQIAMEYTDGAGVQHRQNARFLVGREHQPPRSRMAPFRLDQGPRSFTPLGFRALSMG